MKMAHGGGETGQRGVGGKGDRFWMPSNVHFGGLLMQIMYEIMYEKHSAQCLVPNESPYMVATMMEVMGEE